jgi:hypothetical protein
LTEERFDAWKRKSQDTLKRPSDLGGSVL